MNCKDDLTISATRKEIAVRTLEGPANRCPLLYRATYRCGSPPALRGRTKGDHSVGPTRAPLSYVLSPTVCVPMAIRPASKTPAGARSHMRGHRPWPYLGGGPPRR